MTERNPVKRLLWNKKLKTLQKPKRHDSDIVSPVAAMPAPKTIENPLQLLIEDDFDECDIVFAPPVEYIYPYGVEYLPHPLTVLAEIDAQSIREEICEIIRLYNEVLAKA